MDYKYKLNFYEVQGSKLLPNVIIDFISSVIANMESDNFVINVDLSDNKIIVRSNSDFENVIDKFETNGLYGEYYEDEGTVEIVNEDEESMYILDTSSLTFKKLITTVIRDLIESAKHLIVKGQDDYYNYYSWLSSIVIDMLNSKIVVKSDYSLYKNIERFENNGLPYRHYSTLSY